MYYRLYNIKILVYTFDMTRSPCFSVIVAVIKYSRLRMSMCYFALCYFTKALNIEANIYVKLYIRFNHNNP